MSDELKSQLSAFVDDELTPEESELFVRRLCRDENLRRTATSYNMIGDAIRGDMAVTAPAGFVAGVMMAVEGQTVPVVDTPAPDRGHAARNWGYAVAASVIVAAIALITLPGNNPAEPDAFVADTVEIGDTVETADLVVAQDTGSVALYDGARRDLSDPYDAVNAQAVSALTASAQNVPIVMPVSVERRAQLNNLLLQHYNSSGASRQPGLVRFRNVGFVTQTESQR